jgi:hypothetical protein
MPISASWNSTTTTRARHGQAPQPRKLRPVLVFLDGQGKEVARLTGGLKTAEDALLLDRFVAEKHYPRVDFSKPSRRARRADRHGRRLRHEVAVAAGGQGCRCAAGLPRTSMKESSCDRAIDEVFV